MDFEWDNGKAVVNRYKHGIAFELAITVFDDPELIVAEDVDHSTGAEPRWHAIGKSDAGVLVVVFTIRHSGEVRRLISARPASRRERMRYEEKG
jgi:uncharacterized DUF497 family protein